MRQEAALETAPRPVLRRPPLRANARSFHAPGQTVYSVREGGSGDHPGQATVLAARSTRAADSGEKTKKTAHPLAAPVRTTSVATVGLCPIP